jgi:hypothetical protein
MKPIESNHVQVVADAKGAVLGLRRALMDLMHSVNADPMRPQDVSRQFKLDKTLTWKISRVIREDDAASAISHVPGRRRMQSLISAMELAGAPVHLLEATQKSFDEFERFVELHSGDRDTLDVIVTNAASEVGRKRQEVFRKSGFQSNAAVWGVRAKAQIGINFVGPAQADGTLETATLCGFVGLQRLRANLPWAVANAFVWGDERDEALRSVPLHPDGTISGGPLLPQFCSKPLPMLRTVSVDKNNSRYELLEGPVGQGSAVDLYLGWRWPRLATMYGQDENDLGEHGLNLSTPVETAILELWVHRSLTFAMNPVARVYSALPSGPKYPNEGREAGLLPLYSDVVDLGPGVLGASSPEVPRGAELVAFAANRLGQSAQDYHGFRLRIKYPPIPTVAFLQHPLLPRP